MGAGVQCVTAAVGRSTPKPCAADGGEATVKVYGVAVAMLPGYSWAPIWPIDDPVNVGTTCGRPGRRAAGLVVGRSAADCGPWVGRRPR